MRARVVLRVVRVLTGHRGNIYYTAIPFAFYMPCAPVSFIILASINRNFILVAINIISFNGIIMIFEKQTALICE